MYKIENGKKIFFNQSEGQKKNANIELLKELEQGSSLFPKGWCLEVSRDSIPLLVKKKIAKKYNYKKTAESIRKDRIDTNELIEKTKVK